MGAAGSDLIVELCPLPCTFIDYDLGLMHLKDGIKVLCITQSHQLPNLARAKLIIIHLMKIVGR
jgi:hypothetical protein